MPASKKGTSTTLYSVHPGVAMVQETIVKMKDRTGRTLDEWLAFVEKDGPPAERDRRVWLKDQGLGTNYAGWVAEWAGGKREDGDPDAYLAAAETYVEEMYAGKKADLLPIYDELLALSLGLASDVKACPCKTIVPLYRNHVFAQLKPTTNTRIDLGLALGSTRAPARLIDTGGYAKKDRITHRIPIASLDDIDDEVKSWLKKAYDRDAK